MLKDLRAFLKEFRSNFHTTGAMLPSSRYLASEITSRLARRPAEPVRVLEVGPATGSFTRKILTYLGPDDHLDLCEINPAFVRHLKTWLGKLPNSPHIRIFDHSILQVEPEARYDFIISGLPLNNFAPEEVRAILKHFRRLGHDGTEFSDFEYWSLRTLRVGLSTGRQRGRMKRIDRVVRRFIWEHGHDRSIVWLNIPPARVLHFCFQEKNNGQRIRPRKRARLPRRTA